MAECIVNLRCVLIEEIFWETASFCTSCSNRCRGMTIYRQFVVVSSKYFFFLLTSGELFWCGLAALHMYVGSIDESYTDAVNDPLILLLWLLVDLFLLLFIVLVVVSQMNGYNIFFLKISRFSWHVCVYRNA